jgi:hypothetical protein
MKKTQIDIFTFTMLYLLTFVFLDYSLIAENTNIVDREVLTFSYPVKPKDTLNKFVKIFIRGRVVEKQNPKEYIAYATIMLKGTKVGCVADSLGYYSLDLTAIADTAKEITIYCSYIAYKRKEIRIDTKILSTIIINFELENQPACELPEIHVKQKNKKMRTRKQN